MYLAVEPQPYRRCSPPYSHACSSSPSGQRPSIARTLCTRYPGRGRREKPVGAHVGSCLARRCRRSSAWCPNGRSSTHDRAPLLCSSRQWCGRHRSSSTITTTTTRALSRRRDCCGKTPSWLQLLERTKRGLARCGMTGSCKCISYVDLNGHYHVLVSAGLSATLIQSQCPSSRTSSTQSAGAGHGLESASRLPWC